MRRRIEQRLVLVLPVELDEVARRFAQHRGGRQRAVDERPAAALRRDLPADQHLAAVRPLRRPPRRSRLLAGPDQIRRGAAAQQQPDRSDEHRLARAGLAGEDGEAGFELDLNGFDDRQVADRQVRSIGWPSRKPCEAELPSYHTFDSNFRRVLPCPVSRCSQRRILRCGRRMSLRTLGIVVPGTSRCKTAMHLCREQRSASSNSSLRQPGRRRRSWRCSPSFSVVSWAHHPAKSLALPRGRAADARRSSTSFRRSSKFSEVQAVCKSLEQARSSASFRPAMPRSTLQLRPDAGDGRPVRRPPPPRPTLKSLAARGPRAPAGVGGRR